MDVYVCMHGCGPGIMVQGRVLSMMRIPASAYEDGLHARVADKVLQASLEVAVDDAHVERILVVGGVYKVNDLVKVVGSGKEKGVYVCEGVGGVAVCCFVACYGGAEDVQHNRRVLASVEAEGRVGRSVKMCRMMCAGRVRLPIDVQGTLDTIYCLLKLGLEKGIAMRVDSIDHIHYCLVPRRCARNAQLVVFCE